MTGTAACGIAIAVAAEAWQTTKRGRCDLELLFERNACTPAAIIKATKPALGRVELLAPAERATLGCEAIVGSFSSGRMLLVSDTTFCTDPTVKAWDAKTSAKAQAAAATRYAFEESLGTARRRAAAAMFSTR